MCFPGVASGKESTCQCRRHRRPGFDLSVRKIPWRRKWQPTLVFLPGKSHGQRILVGYSPWGPEESDMTEHKHDVEYAGVIKITVVYVQKLMVTEEATK